MKIKTILLADDDPALVDALAIRCRAIGLSVRAAHSALEALKSACDHPPDIICLDVEMPGGNGFSACELLSGECRLALVPIIILTGKTDGETIRHCHNLCAYYVPKCTDVWSRIEPLLYELLDLSATTSKSQSLLGSTPSHSVRLVRVLANPDVPDSTRALPRASSTDQANARTCPN